MDALCVCRCLRFISVQSRMSFVAQRENHSYMLHKPSRQVREKTMTRMELGGVIVGAPLLARRSRFQRCGAGVLRFPLPKVVVPMSRRSACDDQLRCRLRPLMVVLCRLWGYACQRPEKDDGASVVAEAVE